MTIVIPGELAIVILVLAVICLILTSIIQIMNLRNRKIGGVAHD